MTKEVAKQDKNIGLKDAAKAVLSLVPKTATAVSINVASLHDASLLIYGQVFDQFDGDNVESKKVNRKFLLDLALS